MPKNCLKYLLVLAVILIVVRTCACDKKRVKKFKRKVDDAHLKRNNLLQKEVKNLTNHGHGRGFFTPGLFSLGKVLNFFPVGGERECQPSAFTVARAGICLNPYDCRQRDGKAAGDCAHGLGVCCVFEVTCGGVVQNNLTYFLSPGFPELWSGERDCDITIDKTHAGITQLRVDFVHFTIGQPNRTTGECDEDAMILGEGKGKVVICGQNHGQHCTIMTFNFAINGRHLAAQEYRACIRRNVGYCAVRYMACDSRSFRIGPGGDAPYVMDPADLEYGPGAAGGPGTGFYGPDGSYMPGTATTMRTNITGDQIADETQNGSMQQEQLMPVNGAQTQDEEEGSGADPQIAPMVEENVAPPSIASRIWSFIFPSWLWGQRSRARTWGWSRWSPYAQHYAQEDDKFRYYGYGNFGVGLQGYGRQRCRDRITIPCENEYFVSSTSYIPGVCDPHHCGDTFCPGVPHDNCRVETSITPFAVSFHFGPPAKKRSPEENIGACLRYTQLPCDA